MPWTRRIDCANYSKCLGRQIQAHNGRDFEPTEFDCNKCPFEYQPSSRYDMAKEAGRAMDLVLAVFEPDLPKHEKPAPKPKRKRPSKRRLEKIADLAVAAINGVEVLCSELEKGQAFYVMPVNSATGLPRFELYQRRDGDCLKTV